MENKIMKEVAFTIQHIKDLISKKTQCDKLGKTVTLFQLILLEMQIDTYITL